MVYILDSNIHQLQTPGLYILSPYQSLYNEYIFSKIGLGINISKRLDTYKTYYPFGFYLLGYLEINTSNIDNEILPDLLLILEAALHNILSAYTVISFSRRVGEWFLINRDALYNAVQKLLKTRIKKLLHIWDNSTQYNIRISGDVRKKTAFFDNFLDNYIEDIIKEYKIVRKFPKLSNCLACYTNDKDFAIAVPNSRQELSWDRATPEAMIKKSLNLSEANIDIDYNEDTTEENTLDECNNILQKHPRVSIKLNDQMCKSTKSKRRTKYKEIHNSFLSKRNWKTQRI